jgi:hypothetical protein
VSRWLDVPVDVEFASGPSGLMSSLRPAARLKMKYSPGLDATSSLTRTLAASRSVTTPSQRTPPPPSLLKISKGGIIGRRPGSLGETILVSSERVYGVHCRPTWSGAGHSARPQPTFRYDFQPSFNALRLLLSPDSIPKFLSESAAASSPIPAPGC